MEVFIKANRILCIDRNSKKLFCNYDYEKYSECDAQIVNDFVINNYYHYGDKIIYHKSIIDLLNKPLYEITLIEKDKYKIKLKYEVIMYIKVREIFNEREEILEEYIINEVEDKKYISDSIIYSNSEFAVKGFNEDEEFYINNAGKIKYEIIDKEYFIRENKIKKAKRIVFCDKSFKSKIFVVKRPSNVKELESITYLIRKEDGNLVYLNGYYNLKKRRYEIVEDTIHEIKGLIRYLLIYTDNTKIKPTIDVSEKDYYMNEESELAQYGYSVREGVTTEKRHVAIQKALNNGMTKGEIEKHLMYLIERDKNNPRLINANEKRSEDLEYLRNINLDKQRKVLLN